MEQQQPQQNGGSGSGAAAGAAGSGGLMYVKVMTDDQMEVLRKQIAAYATICEKLVEMHKSFTAQQDLAGARLGNPYCDPMMTSGGHKYTSRQRWTPTPLQLQILERIFDQGIGTPSKQKIKDITTELSQHGQISETNVYNWFQNRRARSKRKQLVVAPNNGESEVETDVESPTDKKSKAADNFQAQVNNASRAEDLCFQSPDISSDMHSLGPQFGKAEPAAMSVGQLSFYDSMLSNPRMDHLMGKMEAAGSYNPYQQQTDNYPA